MTPVLGSPTYALRLASLITNHRSQVNVIYEGRAHHADVNINATSSHATLVYVGANIKSRGIVFVFRKTRLKLYTIDQCAKKYIKYHIQMYKYLG